MSFEHDSNSYGASESQNSNRSSQRFDPKRFYVDGNLIMCNKVVTLPDVCVITGARDDLTLIEKRIVYVPGWCYLTLLAGIIGGVIAWLVLHIAIRTECSASFFLSRAVRRKLWWRTFFGVIGIIVASFVIAYGARWNDEQPALIIGGLVLLLVSLILLTLGRAPLSISRHDSGTTFWLKGAMPEFFDELRRMYNA